MSAITGLWEEKLHAEFKKPYYKTLYEKVGYAYRNRVVYPPKDEIFAAFHLTPLEKVKVVILGQDPYHGKGQAEGLCFSVKKGVAIPPSLENIYKELSSDIGCDIPAHGSLKSWAKQGVLLLNTVLTVEAGRAFSHSEFGWQTFTDAAIAAVAALDRPVVFILWGRPAQQKSKMIYNPKHLILKAPHPSPLSAYRGFFGSRPFSKANAFLEEHGEQPISWEIAPDFDE